MQAHALTPACIPRRRLLQRAGALATLGVVALPPARAAADDAAGDAAAAFAAQSFAEALALLGGAPTPSPQVTLQVPDVADNGAFVPVTVSSALPGTREIVILVDGNPVPVALQFTVPAGTEPWISTRIRMAGPGTVYAVVRTDSGLHAAACTVAVTVGGCG
jgi:sulfur-oxidizing protein SoxY